ncbi:unnamed protein product [Didymodactylos carnosus]|uniref:Uncharacterized protein n=1 Tax=Didymodactylos carnosus TaxID=1234261 RepID=A0A815RHQ2_9BILA|nr:unnamed protein product [Didymodactylos carnosus]CAF1475253.1 unnamed protein product [Didymodactylos carnosus]CAF3973815.1 unnamed protein product [Didymodactylos carnosus]CAF4341581.1 unnamed protein product [Didymodactylos carnosus]
MNGLKIVKALLIRIALIAHGLICAWRVVDTNDNQYCWVILVGLGFLLVETGIVIWLRNGQEFKTVAFCIIFYMTCSASSLWIIHVETANKKLYRLAESKLSARRAPTIGGKLNKNSIIEHHKNSSILARLITHSTTTTAAQQTVLSIAQVDCEDKAWYYVDEQRWLDALQESMLALLCLCRLLISRDHLSVEKSGILLILSIMNSADILSISNSLQYHDVIIERLWMYVGLILFTIVLFQLAFIETNGLTYSYFNSQQQQQQQQRRYYYHKGQTVAERFRSRLHRASIEKINFLQDQLICPLFKCLFLHDGLFLIYRILLSVKIRCSKPTLIFYISKNVFMILYQCYRVYKCSKDKQKRLIYERLFDLTSANGKKQRRHPFHFIEQLNNNHHPQHHTTKAQLNIDKNNRRRTLMKPRMKARYPSKTMPTDYGAPYPFVRRQRGGKTSYAVYGLPFVTQPRRRATLSSSSQSLMNFVRNDSGAGPGYIRWASSLSNHNTIAKAIVQ